MRYHIFKGKKRTTVHMDTILSSLLAIKLGMPPDTPEAKNAVRDWLQAQIDRQNDPGRIQTSQWLRAEAIFYLADKELIARYNSFLIA